MSSTLDKLASKLGEDVMKVMDETGDDRLFMEIAGIIGAASQTLEEAFLTDVRIRLAERKARAALVARLKAHRATQGGRGKDGPRRDPGAQSGA